MELEWNCGPFLANLRPFVMPLHQVAGWRMRMSTGAWPRLPKVFSCAHLHVSIFFKLLAGLKMILSHGFWRTRYDKMSSYSTSHVMGIGWKSGCKELADRDAPKPKVQVCCEPQQMPEGQKARFEPTFCTCDLVIRIVDALKSWLWSGYWNESAKLKTESGFRALVSFIIWCNGL